MHSIRKFVLRPLAVVFLIALMAASCDQRGPDPTDASLNAAMGPFGVGTVTVPTSAGFGGGTIFYPTGVSGPFAVISVSPGFTETAANLDWGNRLASNGFVTIVINTSNTFENPATRSTEQRQALTYAINQSNTSGSPIAGLVDANRKGVAGHSMGGGATLLSEQADPTILAGAPWAPWNTSTDFSNVTVPTLITACQNDSIAAVNQHASPMYNSIPASTHKSYISVAGQDHFCANAASGANGEVGRFVVAFFKKVLDTDTRYDPWVCGAKKPTVDSNLNEVRSTCPF
jgi:dienelactone hydrolase